MNNATPSQWTHKDFRNAAEDQMRKALNELRVALEAYPIGHPIRVEALLAFGGIHGALKDSKADGPDTCPNCGAATTETGACAIPCGA